MNVVGHGRAADVVDDGNRSVDLSARLLARRNLRFRQPEVFPLRVAGAVGFRNDVAPAVVDRMHRAVERAGVGDHPDDQLLAAIVSVGALQAAGEGNRLQAGRVVIGVGIDRAQPRVRRDVAGRIVHERTHRGRADDNVGDAVGPCRIAQHLRRR